MRLSVRAVVLLLTTQVVLWQQLEQLEQALRIATDEMGLGVATCREMRVSNGAEQSL